MNTSTNEIECRVYGLQRSGNHALISWVIAENHGVVVHLNDIKPTHIDPYEGFAQLNVKNLPFWVCKPYLPSLVKHRLLREKKHRFVRSDSRVRVESVRSFAPKRLLIHSYENYSLTDDRFDRFDQAHDVFVGPSGRRIEVLILRDPYNLFASMIAAGMMTPENRDRLVALFKQYAREFMDETAYISGDRVRINYNRWCVDPAYRRETAQALGFTTSGAAYMNVPREGGGSSFSGRRFNRKAQQLKVLERWKRYRDNPFYREIFRDEALVRLSDHIFGPVAEGFKQATQVVLKNPLPNLMIDVPKRQFSP